MKRKAYFEATILGRLLIFLFGHNFIIRLGKNSAEYTERVRELEEERIKEEAKEIMASYLKTQSAEELEKSFEDSHSYPVPLGWGNGNLPHRILYKDEDGKFKLTDPTHYQTMEEYLNKKSNSPKKWASSVKGKEVYKEIIPPTNPCKHAYWYYMDRYSENRFRPVKWYLLEPERARYGLRLGLRYMELSDKLKTEVDKLPMDECLCKEKPEEV